MDSVNCVALFFVIRNADRAIVMPSNAPGGAARDSMETLHTTTFNTPVGPLFLAASGKGLVALEFDLRLPGQQTVRPNPRDLRVESKLGRFEVSERAMCGYEHELREYFAGQRRDFSFA